MIAKVCKYCGLPPEEHHVFECVDTPEGCKCDTGTWSFTDEITPICAEYKGDGDMYCETCEHDRECHVHVLAAGESDEE